MRPKNEAPELVELKESLKNRRKYLPPGYGKKLAVKFHCSESRIYRIAAGTLFDLDVVEWMIYIADEYKEKLVRINSRLKQI